MKNSNFSHLHIHTDYSQLDGAGKIKEYIEYSKELGFKALAITDHGNMDGVIKFQKECISQKIIPIIGCEAYIVSDAKVKEKGDDRRHVTLLVKNQTGWSNLCQLLTYANLEGFYYRPRIDYAFLLEHCEGLVVMTGCAGTFLMEAEGEKAFFKLSEKINDDLYIEIMPHDIEVQHTAHKLLIDLYKETGIKLVATNDCHYVYEDDWEAQEVLLAIQRKKKWNDKKRWKFGFTGLHLRTADEMIAAFKKQGDIKSKDYLLAMSNTMEIVEKCKGFKIEKREISLPDIPNIKTKNYDNYLFKYCENKLNDNQIYYDRFIEEFKLIKSKKFSKYFLLVHELVSWCRENNIGVGFGRGSVGASLIAYLLGIHDIDPIKFDLLFWRFISEERIDYPDIDIDIEHSKRELVKEHLRELYGRDKIAAISNYLTMKGKMAVRDVSRVFEVPEKDVKSFTSIIDDDKTNENLIEDALLLPEGKEFKRKYPKVVEIALILQGQVRGYGQHAAGLVISQEDLITSNKCNLILKGSGDQQFTSINWDMEDCEYMGLIKLDILGLKEVTIIGETLRLVKQNHNKDIDPAKINLEDKKVLKEFAAGNNVGVFQFNSWGMIDLCKKLRIDSFNMLSHANALYRPGTLRSGVVDKFVERKKKKKWDVINKEIERITSYTFGIIVYQEQVMEIANSIAGLSWKDADKIRKIIGKSKGKSELKKYKERFITGCIESKKLNNKEAIELWKQLEEFGSYGFNKAHSVAYSMIGYCCQWLKKYYPTEFICAALTYGSKDKKAEIIKEAYRLGLPVILPKAGKSDASNWIVKSGNLYCPFMEVKGIGSKKAIEIMNKPLQEEKSAINETASSCKGFFYGQRKGEERKINNRKIKQIDIILDEIGAYDKEDCDVKKTAEKYFTFTV
uniref:Putative DNA polymerase n=1 Tax=viral metagenome TaxID=1070528 RepID=A0A6M3KVX9_9ZZZZ